MKGADVTHMAKATGLANDTGETKARHAIARASKRAGTGIQTTAPVLRRLADGRAAEALVVMLGVMAVGLGAAAFAPVPAPISLASEHAHRQPLEAPIPVPPGIGGAALR